jgi:predicted ATP-grasp superfamily ATP-dependent carboligase
MTDPSELYALHTDQTDLDHPILLHSMAGFLDAGSAGRIAVDTLLATHEHRRIATFDLDSLYDYRARRPRMTFMTDHYESVDLPSLVLSELRGEAGRRFLLLHGVEPDFGWQGVVAAVISLVDRFEVPLSVGMHAVPWPAPHTRPVSLTAHATDRSLIAGRTSWVGALEVPGHIAGLLELELGQTEHKAMGFAAHVPHYLAAAEYPRAAVALLEATASVTGLELPLAALRESADRTDREIEAQIAASPENLDAVRALESQYDAFVSQQNQPRPDAFEGPLPSGDEIASQVERFLSEMDARGRDDT